MSSHLQDEALPKPVEKVIAAKAAEALGLLTLIKPLLKKAGRLTASEQVLMLNGVESALQLLRDANDAAWQVREARWKARDTQTMVAKGNGSQS